MSRCLGQGEITRRGGGERGRGRVGVTDDE